MAHYPLSLSSSWRDETTTLSNSDYPSSQLRHFQSVLQRACEAVKKLPEAQAAAATQALHHQLVQLIELQTLEAHRVEGKASADTQLHARYLKAALADEVLLSQDWHGKPMWRQMLLETQLFRSSCAGDKVFNTIDQILAEREAAQRPIARLYLCVLSLGYLGRYRNSPEMEQVAQYRRDLFQFIYLRAPNLDSRDKVISPSAYTSTLNHLAARRIHRISRPWVMGIAVFLALLALSEVLWLWQSWPVRTAIAAGSTP